MVNVNDIKKLREATGAGIADCREALEATKNDLKKAQEYLKQKGIEKAEKKADRETGVVVVGSYVHAGGTLGSIVALGCETDFVAKTEDFKTLLHEVAMQVASMKPKTVTELLKQEYIRDPKVTIEDLIKGVVGKLGENIKVVDFKRLPE